ncbi:ANK-REP-REGION domain-containing protein [Mycena chlorophos]|uniref:ANK-REP-REGION domain-containing protein n=1 Tax=Mycena chlorophos TaxID=658473 RepID=A0A8H6RXR1_MYCCL|nr:ANK-REP-REGION domain-containing protein [Mycena chlorophos]
MTAQGDGGRKKKNGVFTVTCWHRRSPGTFATVRLSTSSTQHSATATARRPRLGPKCYFENTSKRLSQSYLACWTFPSRVGGPEYRQSARVRSSSAAEMHEENACCATLLSTLIWRNLTTRSMATGGGIYIIGGTGGTGGAANQQGGGGGTGQGPHLENVQFHQDKIYNVKKNYNFQDNRVFIGYFQYQDTTKSIPAQKEPDVLDHFAPAQFLPPQNSLVEYQAKSTGSWLLSNPDFLEWESSAGTLLYCSGNWGVGKTVLVYDYC